MAINRSVDQKPVSVAEVHLSRVAGDGCARHSHLSALLEAPGAILAAIWLTPFICFAASMAIIQD